MHTNQNFSIPEPMRNLILIFLSWFILFGFSSSAQTRATATFCWPQNWWIGMKENHLLLLLHGTEMSMNKASITYPGVTLTRQFPGQNSSYLFLEIGISDQAGIGNVPIILTRGNRTMAGPVFSLSRRKTPLTSMPLDGRDAIYQIVPDRYVNGDPNNDNAIGFFERADRMNPSGVHGGDLAGIASSADYIKNLGITTIELTPLYESNQLVLSYEKFSPTNHYSLDPRLGSIEDLRKVVDTYHEKGMKVILTQVLHKIGNQHILAQKPPFFEWIYERPTQLPPTPNPTVFADPYASKEDLDRHIKVWEAFDTPVLNQESETLRRFLIQNVIWWIETSGVDGIRIDKTHLNSPLLLNELNEAIQKQYPGLNLIGAPLTDMVIHNKHWKCGKGTKPLFTHITDMPLNFSMVDAFAEYQKPNDALMGIYKTIASDLVYKNPANEVIVTGDGHDLTRLFTLADKDPVVFRMYMGFLLTVRGIPSFLYGSEIQMEGLALEGSGFVRSDFPGGWSNDQTSAFDQTTLSVRQRDGLRFITTLLKYRNENPELMQGETIQFEPRDEIYAYFRCAGNKKLLVIINNNPDLPRRLESNRFYATVQNVEQVENVISGEISSGLGNIILNPKSILILELTLQANQ